MVPGLAPVRNKVKYNNRLALSDAQRSVRSERTASRQTRPYNGREVVPQHVERPTQAAGGNRARGAVWKTVSGTCSRCDLVFYDLTSTYSEGLGPEELASTVVRPAAAPPAAAGGGGDGGRVSSHTVFVQAGQPCGRCLRICGAVRVWNVSMFAGDRGMKSEASLAVGGPGAGLLDGGAARRNPEMESVARCGRRPGRRAKERTGGSRRTGPCGAGGDGGRVAEAAFFGASAGAGTSGSCGRRSPSTWTATCRSSPDATMSASRTPSSRSAPCVAGWMASGSPTRPWIKDKGLKSGARAVAVEAVA